MAGRPRSSALAAIGSIVALAACGAPSAPRAGGAETPAGPSEPGASAAGAPAHGGSGAATPSERAASASAAPATAAGTWPFDAPPAEALAAQTARLEKDPGPLKSNWEPPGRTERYGHAEAIVAAPYDAVRAKLLDFARYKDLAGPKFKNVRIIDKQPGATDVYFNLPIMKGLVTLWYVTRFTAPRPGQGGEVVEGTFVKGNIKGMHVAFGIRKEPDGRGTVMTCDLLLSLNIPAPQANVDEELRDACGDAIHSVRRLTAAPPLAASSAPPAPPPPAPPPAR